MSLRFFLSLLLALQLVLTPLAQSRPALAATGQLASLAAGGDARDTALAGRLSRSIDKNNRQLHKTEAEKLEALLNEAETKEEKQRLRAAACYLVKCSNGVADGSGPMDEEDSAHNELAALQEKGAGYTKEIAALKGTGKFEHTTEDSLEDALRRNRRLTETARGGIDIGSGTAAMVSGSGMIGGSLTLCIPTVGLSCFMVAGGAVMATDGTVGVRVGGQRLRSVFNGSDAYTDEGQRVLDSFSPSTHRGDESLVREVGIDTAKNIATAAAGGVVLKYGSKLALNKLGNAKDYVVGGFTKSDVSAPKGGLDLNKFSSQDRKSFTTLEKRIVEHEQKLADFKANPTVRPGMENQPPEVIRVAQERRISHLEREIAAFRKNQNDIASNYD